MEAGGQVPQPSFSTLNACRGTGALEMKRDQMMELEQLHLMPSPRGNWTLPFRTGKSI